MQVFGPDLASYGCLFEFLNRRLFHGGEKPHRLTLVLRFRFKGWGGIGTTLATFVCQCVVGCLMFVGCSLTVARQLKLLRSLVVEKQPTRSVEETNRYFVQVVPTAAKVWLSMGCGDRLMVFALLEP